MSRARKLLLIAVAWACPCAWFAAALLSGPVDGATLTTTTLGLERDGWTEPVRVVRTYGDTPLRTDDLVTAIDGRTPSQWLTEGAPEREVGDVVGYRVQRPGQALDVDLDIDVVLVRYPVVAAVRDNPAAGVLAVALLVSGSLVLWRRPHALPARAFLVGTSLLPCVLTASPWGVGPVDLAGGRGVWPHAGGEALAAAGLGCLLLAVLTVTSTGPLRRPLAVAVSAATPVAGYLAWLALALPGTDDGVARAHVVATVLTPALLACLPAALLGAWVAHRRTDDREERLATRLVLLGIGTAVTAWAMLEVLPRAVSRDPAVPGSVLGLLLVPVLVGSLGVAVARYRVGDIEPAVRRALVQVVGVALVGAVFVGLRRSARRGLRRLRGVDAGRRAGGTGSCCPRRWPCSAGCAGWSTATGTSRDRSCPTCARSTRRRPRRRHCARRWSCSPGGCTCPTPRSRCSPRPTQGRSRRRSAHPRGTPVTVDLAVGGTALGRLRLEVDPARDPFGPGDRRLLEDVGHAGRCPGPGGHRSTGSSSSPGSA